MRPQQGGSEAARGGCGRAGAPRAPAPGQVQAGDASRVPHLGADEGPLRHHVNQARQGLNALARLWLKSASNRGGGQRVVWGAGAGTGRGAVLRVRRGVSGAPRTARPSAAPTLSLHPQALGEGVARGGARVRARDRARLGARLRSGTPARLPQPPPPGSGTRPARPCPPTCARPPARPHPAWRPRQGARSRCRSGSRPGWRARGGRWRATPCRMHAGGRASSGGPAGGGRGGARVGCA